jgi:hypothetical protein
VRGGINSLGRGGPPRMPGNEALTRSYEHPSPYDGWNARGNLANMRPTEAIQMDNVFPGVQTVNLRNGCINWKTSAAANVHSLLPYSGISSSKLFAATNAGIYDVTTAGAFGAAAVACTNGYWKSVMMATAGGNFLWAANGVDNAKCFDGAAWTVPVITGVSSANLIYPTVHKHRIFAIEKNTMNIWYLAVESIAGAATVFPVGSLFKKGGIVVAIGAWTLDGGSGIDDYFVIVTSNGEIAIYQGTDPNSSATWALVGVFDVAQPVGDRPLIDFGGDLLYLSAVGLIPLSKLTQSTILDRSSNISFNIDGAFIDAATSYKSNLGWQMLLHKSANLLLVNIPVATDTTAYQFVMNTVTKAWCRFTGWNAACWAEFNGDIYFAGGNKVSKAWVGANDAGTPIVGLVAQAYARLGSSIQKKVELARPNFGFTGSAQLQMNFDADFKTFGGNPTIFTYTPSAAGAVWDLSLWDTGIWDAGVSLFEPKWTTIPGDLGYMHSLRLQIVASSGNFTWTSTNLAIKGAGIL